MKFHLFISLWGLGKLWMRRTPRNSYVWLFSGRSWDSSRRVCMKGTSKINEMSYTQESKVKGLQEKEREEVSKNSIFFVNKMYAAVERSWKCACKRFVKNELGGNIKENMSGFGQKILCETPVTETLRKHISRYKVLKFADFIKSVQEKKALHCICRNSAVFFEKWGDRWCWCSKSDICGWERNRKSVRKEGFGERCSSLISASESFSVMKKARYSSIMAEEKKGIFSSAICKSH